MSSDTTPVTESVSYFFFLRLQWTTETKQKSAEFHGTLPVPRGSSRLQVFKQLCEYAKDHGSAPANADITAFTLEPDQL